MFGGTQVFFSRGRQCAGCGDVFNNKDAPFKEIDHPDSEYPTVLQLGTEDGSVACPNSGDRYAPELMRQMRDMERRRWGHPDAWADARALDDNDPIPF